MAAAGLLSGTTRCRRTEQAGLAGYIHLECARNGHIYCLPRYGSHRVLTFILWLLLFIFCWPLALLALVLYPIVWLLLLPFRLIGIAVDGVFELLRSVLFLPARILRGRP